ncbi:MAG: alpha/beta fold hydrolase [Pseudomonadota bacterium]
MSAFEPAPILRSAHLQTILGSRGRGRWVRQRAAAALAASKRQILTASDGVRLEAWLSEQPHPAPAIVLIHGWLGHADSSYLLSAAAELWQAGFSVYRLNLRDHGATAHLNEEMFHSARINEVLDAIDQLGSNHAKGPLGLVGFSLGGNFALRVARARPQIETVAICPAVDPFATMRSIDTGFLAYRLFFLLKWQRALNAKQLAFPERYDFETARKLRSVHALTDVFVRDHTDYRNTEAYLDAYSLTGNALAGTRATIIFAEDDPVIPAAGFRALPESLELVATRYGGHCAYIDDPRQATWTDRFLVNRFEERLLAADSASIAV